jgi:hypothetical protein
VLPPEVEKKPVRAGARQPRDAVGRIFDPLDLDAELPRRRCEAANQGN